MPLPLQIHYDALGSPLAVSSPARERRRILSLCALGAISVASTANFEWLTLAMSPNGETVTLGTLTGAELDSRSSALGLFLLAWAAVLWLVRGLAARVIASIGILAALGSVFVVIEFLANPLAHDASGRIATLQSVAEAHDVSAITPVTTVWPYASALFACVVFGAAIVAAVRGKTWNARSSEQIRGHGTQSEAVDQAESADDPIVLWDSQRDK